MSVTFVSWLICFAPPPEASVKRKERAVFFDSPLTTLWVLNGVFALQTATDLWCMWGGFTLPEVFVPSYVHQGVYVLTFALGISLYLLLRGGFEVKGDSSIKGPRPLDGAAGRSRLGVGYRLSFYIRAYGLTLPRCWMVGLLFSFVGAVDDACDLLGYDGGRWALPTLRSCRWVSWSMRSTLFALRWRSIMRSTVAR